MVRHTRASAGLINSNVAEIANVETSKTRRSHRKSRKGCTECKRRHIRCDERQPSCANCEIAERTCVFPPPKVGKQKRKLRQSRNEEQQSQQATAASTPDSQVSSQTNTNNIDNAGGLDANSHQIPSPASPLQPGEEHTPPADCCPGLSSIPGFVTTKAIFTSEHMVLLQHADKVPNFTGPNRSVVDIAVRRAVDSPYLLDEVLAFTAFHMAYLYPGSAIQLRHLATELQTRALASFTRLTETVPNDDKATAVPRFLFSGILGRHVLADTLTHYRSDFHSFIDRFVECFNLNRGIRAVTPPARHFLNNSEMKPFLDVVLKAHARITSPGNECDPLNQLMDRSDLSETSTQACREAIGVLQWSFDLLHGLDEDEFPQSASAFSVKIEASFVDVLRKYRPEALIILAYYGVLLHRCRSFWAFGDAGAFLIRSISSYLGSYWQEALVWPLHVLETDPNSQSVTPVPRHDALARP
ncbi:Upc2 protein [Colletotrichum karsti]|uniref:Upc2 protein n=1 Tax=Colletotrichum karsti TaxID=1095194 RepID=A0A9P6LNL0_9PEZI|nr:Upc2 protein [Colletotrichum karsti]KAF9879705.1 Upc2 protein [Colletotrichum karsti]